MTQYLRLLYKKLLPFYRHRVYYTLGNSGKEFEVFNYICKGVKDKVDIFSAPKVVDYDTLAYEKTHIFSKWKRTMSRSYKIYLEESTKSLK